MIVAKPRVCVNARSAGMSRPCRRVAPPAPGGGSVRADSRAPTTAMRSTSGGMNDGRERWYWLSRLRGCGASAAAGRHLPVVFRAVGSAVLGLVGDQVGVATSGPCGMWRAGCRTPGAAEPIQPTSGGGRRSYAVGSAGPAP